MDYPTESIKNVVEELSKLPGIGKKTALRLALHLISKSSKDLESLGTSILRLKTSTFRCKKCNNISDSEICNICANPKRDDTTVCVVEEIGDLIAIEKTGYYQGLYHVLGGKISPMEGVGPQQLAIDMLLQRIKNSQISEVILALSTTQEGETTAFYLSKELHQYPQITISHIAKGVPSGSTLEFTDEMTLGKSLLHRSIYQPLTLKT